MSGGIRDGKYRNKNIVIINANSYSIVAGTWSGYLVS